MGAKATAIFDADDSRFDRAIKRIDRALLDTQKKFKHVAKFSAELFAVPLAGAVAMGAGIKQALEQGDHFHDLSANTGIAVKDLAVLEQEFKNAGKAAEDVPMAIAKMQKALASGSANHTLAQMGLDMAALQRMSPADQFHAIGEAIGKLQSPTDRASAAMQVFGKSGASLLSMFSEKGFGDAAKQVGSQAEILAQDAALFDDVSDKLGLIGMKVQGFFIGVADRVVPLLAPLLDQFASLDLAAFGQQIGDALAVAFQSFLDGSWITLIGDALEVSLLRGINSVLQALGAKGFNILGSEAKLDKDIDRLLTKVRAAQAAALAKTPQATPAQGVAELTSGGVGPVTALQRIGGAMGGGGDPVLESNRLLRDHSDYLRDIRDALRPAAKPGGSVTMSPTYA